MPLIEYTDPAPPSAQPPPTPGTTTLVAILDALTKITPEIESDRERLKAKEIRRSKLRATVVDALKSRPERHAVIADPSGQLWQLVDGELVMVTVIDPLSVRVPATAETGYLAAGFPKPVKPDDEPPTEEVEPKSAMELMADALYESIGKGGSSLPGPATVVADRSKDRPTTTDSGHVEVVGPMKPPATLWAARNAGQYKATPAGTCGPIIGMSGPETCGPIVAAPTKHRSSCLCPSCYDIKSNVSPFVDR